MSNCAIVGINWGDEGKGRIVDLLSKKYDYVVRYQGGGNAGHTVVNEYGKFALHLIPSGIFRKGVVNVLGNGVALDPESLWEEIDQKSKILLIRRYGSSVAISRVQNKKKTYPFQNAKGRSLLEQNFNAWSV